MSIYVNSIENGPYQVPVTTYDRGTPNTYMQPMNGWHTTSQQIVPLKSEVDSQISALDSKTDGLSNQIGVFNDQIYTFNQKIDKTAADLNSLVTDSINKLPQRLLSDEVKNALKETILIELRNELDSIRQDLQNQINDLKVSIP